MKYVPDLPWWAAHAALAIVLIGGGIIALSAS